MNVQLIGGIADYKFDSFEDALKRIIDWKNRDLCTERDLMGFIVQLFHEIPNDVYNQIIDQG
jgi:hypothetical protein